MLGKSIENAVSYINSFNKTFNNLETNLKLLDKLLIYFA